MKIPINFLSWPVIAPAVTDEALKAVYKTKRMPKYKKKRDTIKGHFIVVETADIDLKGIVGSRGDRI